MLSDYKKTQEPKEQRCGKEHPPKAIQDPDSYLARECIRESFDAVIDYKPSSNDLELQRLVHFVFSNKLIADGENPVDCVIRELAEKHNIDTRSDKQKAADNYCDSMTHGDKVMTFEERVKLAFKAGAAWVGE